MQDAFHKVQTMLVSLNTNAPPPPPPPPRKKHESYGTDQVADALMYLPHNIYMHEQASRFL